MAFQEAMVNNSATNLGSIFGKVKGPISKGYLELRNTNASDNPKVRFNYYESAEDLRRCVQGVKTVINVVNSKSFSSFRYQNTTIQDLIRLRLNNPVNLRPQNPNSTTSLEQFCIDTVMTQWHYHGGCEIGKVVDRDFKVLGVDSLRVIDASTFNFSPGTNPQATILMLGRYYINYSPNFDSNRLTISYIDNYMIVFISDSDIWDEGFCKVEELDDPIFVFIYTSLHDNLSLAKNKLKKGKYDGGTTWTLHVGLDQLLSFFALCF